MVDLQGEYLVSEVYVTTCEICCRETVLTLLELVHTVAATTETGSLSNCDVNDNRTTASQTNK